MLKLLATVTLTVAVLGPELASAQPQPATHANTVYKTSLFGLIPLKVENVRHAYGTGITGWLAVQQGESYRLGIGRLSMKIPTSLGQRLERWLFNRFVFEKKPVVRITKSEGGRIEVQQSQMMVTKDRDRALVEDYTRGLKTTIYPDGHRSVNDTNAGKVTTTYRDGRQEVSTYAVHAPSPGQPITKQGVQELRQILPSMPLLLREELQRRAARN